MVWILTNAMAALLLPPLSLFMLGAAGWLALKIRRPVLGKFMISLAVTLLWLLSTPFFSFQLISWVEKQASPAPDCPPQAIVALGAGTYFNAPEYGGDTVSSLGLERLRLAARLQRQTGLPILVTGGYPDEGEHSEAKLMRSVLENEFGVPVKWIEDQSNNTRENALLSRKLLQGEGIDSVYVVTQAWHMARAQKAFAKAGFCVAPAATGHRTRNRITLLAFLPSAKALSESHTALHEAVGIVWYALSA